MARRFLILDVFTARAFGGNPLAVLPDARGLETERMQAIAREFGFSETSFVLPGEAHPRVRIFTPAHEIPFAGHPTIGTALALAWEGMAPQEGGITLLEGAGPVRVELTAEAGRAASAELTAPQPWRRGALHDCHHCADMLGLDPDDIDPEWRDGVEASAGLPFLIVTLASRDALARARVAQPAFLTGLDVEGVYLATRDTGEPDLDWRARMFAPAGGVAEDPATGSAAAAFAGLLAARAPEALGSWRWRIAQGVEMGRPSLLEAAAEKAAGEVTAVRVGGGAVLVAEGRLLVP